MIKRLLFYDLKKQLEHKNALVIVGMRQVGKSTLMRQLFEEVNPKLRLWFDFDNPLEQKLFELNDYRAIYEMLVSRAGIKGRLSVFIDEIQNFPEITKIIKYLIDHYGVKFVVTGSSAFYLKNLFPESLSGRKFLYYLPPLRFQEILYFRGKITLEQILNNSLATAVSNFAQAGVLERQYDYQQYEQYGGFPEVVVTEGGEQKKRILNNIFSSFFEKDIRLLGDFKDIRELRDLILLLAARAGQVLDITKLASELSVKRPKIYEYLEFLQGVFFIQLPPKFSKSIDRSVAGGRKVFFADTGILNLIARVSEGQVFENAVFNQLAAYGDVSFYRRGRAELDFILDKSIGFEAKTSGDSRDGVRAKKIAGKLALKNVYIVAKNYRLGENIISPYFL